MVCLKRAQQILQLQYETMNSASLKCVKPIFLWLTSPLVFFWGRQLWANLRTILLERFGVFRRLDTLFSDKSTCQLSKVWRRILQLATHLTEIQQIRTAGNSFIIYIYIIIYKWCISRDLWISMVISLTSPFIIIPIKRTGAPANCGWHAFARSSPLTKVGVGQS